MSKYGVSLSVNVWFLEIHFTIFKKRILSRKNHRIPRIRNMLRHNRKMIRNLNLTLSYRWKLKISNPSDYKFDLQSVVILSASLTNTDERPRLFDMRLPSPLVGINLGPRQLSENRLNDIRGSVDTYTFTSVERQFLVFRPTAKYIKVLVQGRASRFVSLNQNNFVRFLSMLSL